MGIEEVSKKDFRDATLEIIREDQGLLMPDFEVKGAFKELIKQKLVVVVPRVSPAILIRYRAQATLMALDMAGSEGLDRETVIELMKMEGIDRPLDYLMKLRRIGVVELLENPVGFRLILD